MSNRKQRKLKLVEHIDARVDHRTSPEQVVRDLKGFMADPDLADEALKVWRDRVSRFDSFSHPRTLTGDERDDWYYDETRPDDVFWPSLQEYLLNHKFEESTVKSIDSESSRVVSCLAPPWSPEIDTRGLVVGHVQSGKTANYTAVTAKAADAGYRIFIVLSGMTNSLRRQTQRRLGQELVSLNEAEWVPLTSEESDFEMPPMGPTSLLADDGRILVVTKKNDARLRKLIDWLSQAGADNLHSAPALVIDDEADYASVNTQEEEGSRSTINTLILELIESLPRAAYLGYTATPFANVFINPQAPKDLYPRSFIHALPTPDEYFGPETVFGRDRLEFDDSEEVDDGYDMIRFVPDGELPDLTAKESDQEAENFEPTVTPGLQDGLRYFLLATAARHVREEEGFYATMLVHTDYRIIVQNRLGNRLREEVEKLRGRLKARSNDLYRELREQWREEVGRVPSEEFGLEPVSFDQLAGNLPTAADDLEVLVTNSTSPDSLDYESERGTYLVVGGNVLSRGLTLEGLLVSFFVRRANNYDTLLQMGRWFGYWEDYADLPRLWMTEELYGFFYDLATVEREIRNDIERYTELGVTPTEFAVRVRTHPELNITSRSKMTSTEEIPSSYSGREIQTTWFRHRDRDWLERNRTAARKLIEAVQTDGRGFALHEDRFRWVARDADVRLIQEFLEEYAFHDNQEEFRHESLNGYINRQTGQGRLEHWNIAVVGQTRDDLGTVELGLPEVTPLISRTRMKGAGEEGQDAYIKALMSRQDVVADFESPPPGASELKWKELRTLRYQRAPYDERGLLVLYPISRDSTPRTDDSQRVPLNAVQDVIGVGLVFPEAEDPQAESYVRAQLDLDPEQGG